MRVLLARLVVLVAVIEALIAVVLKIAEEHFLSVGGGGWLEAASFTVLLAIFLILDDLRDRYQKSAA